LDEIERLEGLIESDPDNASSYEADKQQAAAATEGLRDAVNTKQEELNPILLA
jgi:hypothetical protein